jgi:hypothetical protein
MSDKVPEVLSKSTRLLQAIPALILTVLVDVFIACSTSGIVLVQLISTGHSKHFSLVTAILISILVFSYLIWSYKIRNFIKESFPVDGNLK